MDAECTFICKLVSKAIGLIFYILFQVIQFGIIFCTSALFGRVVTLLVTQVFEGDLLIPPYYEVLVIFGAILFIRQHFLLAKLDSNTVRGIAKCTGIAVADLRFWEGVFETQVIILSQIILGPLLRDIHLNPQMNFDDGPIPTDLSTRSRELMFYYILFVAVIISISSGRTGCSGLCRAAGSETGFCCKPPDNSLGYTNYSLRSFGTFLILLLPNAVLALAYALLLNGFYSVGCVIGMEPVLVYYWLIFISVLIGFGAAALEHRKPFPEPKIMPPYFAFVNNLKAQAYNLHYFVLPTLAYPAFNAKTQSVLYSQNDNFRLFAILASLNVVLQIKLLTQLVRLTVEIQKSRARQLGPPQQHQNQNEEPRGQAIGGQGVPMRRVYIQRLPPLAIAQSSLPEVSEQNELPVQHKPSNFATTGSTGYDNFFAMSANAIVAKDSSALDPGPHPGCSHKPGTASNGNEEAKAKADSAEASIIDENSLNNNNASIV